MSRNDGRRDHPGRSGQGSPRRGSPGRVESGAEYRSPRRGGTPRRGGRPHLAHGGWLKMTAVAKAGYIAATLVAVVSVVAGVGGYAYWRHLEGNVTVVHVGGLSGRTIYGAQNILVLGSQERAGQKGFFGVAPGASPLTSNSDNLLIVHLNPTHTRATVLSIPRDLFVYEPGCTARNSMIGYGVMGPYPYPPGNIIDGALNIGGPTCSVETVEDLTGIKLDHFIEFDFNSFRAMVDAIGGVEVCVPKGGYHDPNSHLNLSAGRHLLKYDQALAYVRTRDDLGGPDEGGDLPRIELQQAFISSVVQKVNSQGLLTNVPALIKIANTATKALTVDQGLGSIESLMHLAESLVHLKSKDVSLITLPTTTDTYDYPVYDQHLMAVQPQDDVLFQMVRTGQTWHGQLPTTPYQKIQVRVLNGTGEAGLAAQTAASLKKLGFDVVGVGDAAYTTTTTVNYAGTAQADDAYTLMTALKSWPAAQNTLAEPAGQIGSPGPVTLTLGTDFAGLNPPAKHVVVVSKKKGKKGKKGSSAGTSAAGQPTVSKTILDGQGAVQSRNAAANICSGLPPPDGN
jgi:LCP family protein required for cell wall assembly